MALNALNLEKTLKRPAPLGAFGIAPTKKQTSIYE